MQCFLIYFRRINNGIVFSVTGDLRMSLLMWCMLILFLCSSSKEMVVDRTRLARCMEKPQNIIRNLKRHSDGTFASDFTHYLDKIKAKDFVEWLASTKQEGQASSFFHLFICFTDDMKTYSTSQKYKSLQVTLVLVSSRSIK
uniref:Glucagon / GIP / secretin / VIP family domain-containing protein n=1 Tax=Scophthalmus maximus TaxID=52904 RepID=A0A8D3BCM8_SCOMX